jgi:hypothetical protein
MSATVVMLGRLEAAIAFMVAHPSVQIFAVHADTLGATGHVQMQTDPETLRRFSGLVASTPVRTMPGWQTLSVDLGHGLTLTASEQRP